MKTFDWFFNDLNEMISDFSFNSKKEKKEKPKKKRKYTKRTFKVNDKDVITEFHPEILFNINKK